MLRRIGTKALFDQRRALLWWGVGIVAFAAVTATFYPSIRESTRSFDDFLEQLPDALRAIFLGQTTDLTSVPGYLDSQIFAINGPILYLIFAIAGGARAIAGEEEAGTLDLLLSTPVRRSRLVLEKLAAIAAGLALLTAVLAATLLLIGPAFDLRTTDVDLPAAAVSLFLLSLVHAALALAVGAATGSRSAAIAVATAVAVAGFLVQSLGPLVDALDRIRWASPFHYYAEARPLEHGLDAGHAAVLLAGSAILAGIAAWAFERRDVGVA